VQAKPEDEVPSYPLHTSLEGVDGSEGTDPHESVFIMLPQQKNMILTEKITTPIQFPSFNMNILILNVSYTKKLKAEISI
jgi:hypothetical protein